MSDVGSVLKPAKIVLPRPTPLATAAAWDRGKINGTSLIRPAYAPARLGGAAKPVTGINGSTFRRKP